jgi:PPOX class probable F420-dependent enzyme
MLATVRPDGGPHAVPVVFAMDGDRVCTAVDAKPKTTTGLARIRNIEHEPRVTLLVDHYDADWRHLWWARADGIARVVHHGPERDAAIALLRARYPQYGAKDGRFGAAIVVAVDRWTGWAMEGPSVGLVAPTAGIQDDPG